MYIHKVVRKGGLEPPRPRTLEPKSSASANSATRARACGWKPYASYQCTRAVRNGGGRQSTPSSRRSRATWPVAFTLYCADTTEPSGAITNVERMSPSYTFP
jgi:hypothetical protein